MFDDERDGGAISAMAVILVSAVVYVVSWLLLQALSRYREFAADRGSALITGRPSALISALYKIEGRMGEIPQRDLRAASGELAAFYIFPPKAKQSISALFATHPTMKQPSNLRFRTRVERAGATRTRRARRLPGGRRRPAARDRPR